MSTDQNDEVMETQTQGRDRSSDADGGTEPSTSTTQEQTMAARAIGAEAGTEGRPPLLAEDRASSFRSRWEEIQVRFVDEPRTAVEEADRLVTEVVDQLQASFTSERGRLEGQWQRGDDVSTEDLRVALRRYRSFFDRLLAA